MANNYGLFFARDGLVIRMPANPEKNDTKKDNENDDYNVLSLGPIVVPRIPALKNIRGRDCCRGDRMTRGY